MLEKIFALIVGGFLILIGGFFLFVAIKATAGNPEVQKALKEAPFITDGKVDPANEGKNIVLMLPTGSLGGTTDDEYGLSFNYPVIHREVEVLEDDHAGHLTWRRVYDSDNALCDKAFFGDVGGMEFKVDSTLMRSFGGKSDKLGPSDFDKDELEAFFTRNSTYHTETYEKVLYITNTDTRYFKDIKKDDVSESLYKDYKEEAGSYRVCYRGTTPYNDMDCFVLIGKQVGNSIVYDEDDHIDTLTCFENVHNTEELLKKDKALLSLGLVVFGYGASIAMLVAGIVIILRAFIKKA